MKLTFITSNLNKLMEARHILKDIEIDNYSIKLPELQGDRRIIIREKAQFAAKTIGRTIVVEDTSLCFNALKELPGPYINDFSTKLGNKNLVKLLSGFPDKKAKVVCSIGYCKPGKEPRIYEGIIYGEIVAPRGRGFGWDPIFQPRGSKKTYGQMTFEEKNGQSHRQKALLKLRNFLLKKGK